VCRSFGSHCFKTLTLTRVAEFDGNCTLFIRDKAALAFCLLPRSSIFAALIPQRPAQPSRRGNYEHDLAFGRVGLVIGKKFTGGTAPKFFEFLC